VRLVVPARKRSVRRAIEWAGERRVTFSTSSPSRYEAGEYARVIGRATADFERARAGLQTWAAHRTPGVRVLPIGLPVEDGATYVVTFGTPLLAIAAPCRVIAVVDEPHRWGFTYRTLAGHPEEGEESFEVELLDDGGVRFTVSARSRPGSRLVALGSPVNHLVQRRVTEGYLRALARYVRNG
jgi:uncharacterized protein (UPF0548 family)